MVGLWLASSRVAFLSETQCTARLRRGALCVCGAALPVGTCTRPQRGRSLALTRPGSWIMPVMRVAPPGEAPALLGSASTSAPLARPLLVADDAVSGFPG